jgi:hypothetical protein
MEAISVLLALIHSRTTCNKRLFVLWVDLRTAFPSLNRTILLHRLCYCGFDVAFCKLILSIFDVTMSVPCIGKCVGKSFKESMGTREGAVESPHLFNAYIGDLRGRLERLHPRLCKLLHITIAVLLYADDAALPADSAEDLELSAKIFEEFCNDMRLYISVGNTFFTVFNNPNYDHVTYSEGCVWVDGKPVVIEIYGQLISATSAFKYLGVLLEANGSHGAHMETRRTATQRAGYSLHAGLLRTPAAPHDLTQYLFRTLVMPVSSYGVELYDWGDNDATRFKKLQATIWRRLLKIGGRAPHDVTCELIGTGCCTVEWRVRRVGLLLRLLNAPPDSWQHVALMHFVLSPNAWYYAAISDLQRVIPLIALPIGCGPAGPFIYSTVSMHNGELLSAQPLALQCDSSGRRSSRPMVEGACKEEAGIIQAHIRNITRRLRAQLTHEESSDRSERLLHQMNNHSYGKSSLAACMVSGSGPRLSIALAFCVVPGHTAALAAFFGGDFFLGRYAGNYFAKPLLPSQTKHRTRLTALNIEASRVCLYCWQYLREMHLEDEAHVVLRCHQYDRQRRDLIMELSQDTLQAMDQTAANQAKLVTLLMSKLPEDWRALGKFLARARQIRRKTRTRLQRLSDRLERHSFDAYKTSWKKEGKFVCRHGVFFETTAPCPCLGPSSEADWSHARLMPVIDDELKCLTIDTFDPFVFARLGVLQAELRRRAW